MTTKEQKFQQVGTNKTFTVEYETQPIGLGAQGKVHRIVRVNKIICVTWVIKLLDASSSQLVKRLQVLVEFIKTLMVSPVSL
jgi:hypothetical protein